MGIRIAQDIFDIFYPVGSYYETSDGNFNPNSATNWYGTWAEDTKSRFLVGYDTSSSKFDTIGETGGDTAFNTTSIASGTRAGSGDNWSYQGLKVNQAVSTLPPYVVVKRWHRTA